MKFDFRQISMPPGELPSTSNATGRPSNNFCQLPVWPKDLSLTSAGRPSVNFHKLSVRRENLLYNFCVVGRPSIPFRQLFERQGDLPSTFVTILCSRETLRQFPSTFRSIMGPSVKICQLPVHRETFLELQSIFCVAGRPCVKFWQLS